MSFSEPERFGFGFVRWVSVSVSVWLLVVRLCRFGECGLLLCRCDAEATRALADCSLAFPRGNQFAERVREELARRVHAQPVLDGARLLRARLCALLLPLSLPFSLPFSHSAARFFFFSFSFAPSFPTARVPRGGGGASGDGGEASRQGWRTRGMARAPVLWNGFADESGVDHGLKFGAPQQFLEHQLHTGLRFFVSWLLRLAS